jgi:hypothetical protein
VADITRRRTDQFRDFMTVLELRAVHFDDGIRVENRISAAASTRRVLPDPVGPRNNKFAIGRPGVAIPAKTD